MKPILIGMTGKARSGKDTAADFLERRHGVNRYAFASPIKSGLRAMLGLSTLHTDGHLKEVVIPRYGRSPRQMMQTLGTEWGREQVSGSIWVDRALEVWEQCQRAGKSLVITDVRFDNEAEAIRNAGGIVCHIHRADAASVAGHKSESGVQSDISDMSIANIGTLSEFLLAVDVNFAEAFL